MWDVCHEVSLCPAACSSQADLGEINWLSKESQRVFFHCRGEEEEGHWPRTVAVGGGVVAVRVSGEFQNVHAVAQVLALVRFS